MAADFLLDLDPAVLLHGYGWPGPPARPRRRRWRAALRRLLRREAPG